MIFKKTSILKKYKIKLTWGFTLIEIIIYIGLLSILMSGLLVIAFQLIQNSEKNNTNNFTQEEINFVFKKIDWALNNSFSIIFPLSDSSNQLEIYKDNFTNNPIIFRLNTNNPKYKYIEYCKGNIFCNPITTQNISVDNLSFVRLNKINQKPDGIQIIITINGIKISNIKYSQL